MFVFGQFERNEKAVVLNYSAYVLGDPQDSMLRRNETKSLERLPVAGTLPIPRMKHESASRGGGTIGY